MITANITRTLQEEKEQAWKEGRALGALKIATNLLAHGLDLNTVLEITDLSKEDYEFLIMATQRLSKNADKSTIPFDTVLSNLGISQEALNAAKDLVIE